MDALSKLLREELDRRGWSVQQLIDESELKPAGVYKILNGDIKSTPTLETLARLSITLDMPLRRLIEACGFSVDNASYNYSGSEQDRVQEALAVVPELIDVAKLMISLPPADRALILDLMTSVARRANQHRDH